MEKDTTICFQTSFHVNKLLEDIAAERKTTVSSVVDDIVRSHFKESKESDKPEHDRRRFERKVVDLSAYLGNSNWQRREFEAITILDISIGGVKFSIPKGTKLEIKTGCEIDKFIIIFRLPNYSWPISIEISPQRIFETEHEIQIGAALLNPDYCAYTALQSFLD